MTDGKPKTARALAAEILSRLGLGPSNAAEILYQALGQTAAVPTRRDCADLVFGTIRNLRCLDMVISTLADIPTERIPRRLLGILRVAVYELLYHPDTPLYAVVNEAVTNASTSARRKQPGFVNAVLRQITRSITDRSIDLAAGELEKTIPQSTHTGCRFSLNLLPNPRTAPVEYLSAAFSLPGWLVQSWLDDFGEHTARQICFASNRRPSIYVRPNPLKTTLANLAEMFRAEAIDFEVIPTESGQDPVEMLRLKSRGAVTELPGFAEGLFSVQDITAALPVSKLSAQPGWLAADICAAPGTKTTQLAEIMQNIGTIIATDIDPKRLLKVNENCRRLGVTIVVTVPPGQLRDKVKHSGCCRLVLLDVPCSNSGVLAKRHEVRYRISPEAISSLSATQRDLLGLAADIVDRAGKICYSTCSLQRQENRDQVKSFLSARPDFSLEYENLTFPSPGPADCDGGYFAVIVKN